MKFSLSWLGELVELPADAAEVARLLTSIGHAVEGIESIDGDAVLDVDVTTNRPDCMNHLGLARELATLLDRPLRLPLAALSATGKPCRVPIRLDDPLGCPRYVGRVVSAVTVGPSPEWLVRRLAAIGQRAINVVVDVTNLVLWETGQPLHAFDLARLAGGEIRVRRARAGEKLTTLDRVARELSDEMLVIADAERPVALAGVMGGLESEVTAQTSTVLLESAHFDRLRVRRGARAAGLHTDASHRFERGADPEGCRFAIDRAARLLVELAGGRVEEEAGEATVSLAPALPWRLERARLDRFAGVAIPPADVERWLTGLGFSPRSVEGGAAWEGTVPSWRQFDFAPRAVDGPAGTSRVAWPADLYEEVLRLHGLDRVPATLPALAGTDVGEMAVHRARARVASHLAGCGLAEAIDFAFHEAAADTRFPRLAGRGEPLALANPISERLAVMRRSLLPNLLGSAAFNARRGAASIRLFELGHLFPGDGAEVEAVAIVLGGRVGTPWDHQRELDFFDLAGLIESTAVQFGARLERHPAELAGFVVGTAAELLAGSGDVVGSCGQVDGEEAPFPLFAAELRLDALGRGDEVRTVDVPSRFPGIAADLTLTHAASVPWREIEAAIRAAAVADLGAFGLKDRYRGKGVPAGAVNTTIWFLYGAEERSLTQEEVNERQQALAADLTRRFAWTGGGER